MMRLMMLFRMPSAMPRRQSSRARMMYEKQNEAHGRIVVADAIFQKITARCFTIELLSIHMSFRKAAVSSHADVSQRRIVYDDYSFSISRRVSS